MGSIYALRIFNGKVLDTVITSRTGLIYDEATGAIGNDLKEHVGKNYVFFDITAQKEIASGVVTENLNCKETLKESNDGE